MDRNSNSGFASNRPEDSRSYGIRILRAVLIVSAVVLLWGLIWASADLLLLAFAGILVAVFFRGISGWIQQRTKFSPGLSLGITIVCLIALVGISGWVLAPQIDTQFSELSRQLPRSFEKIRATVQTSSLGKRFLSLGSEVDSWLPSLGGLLRSVPGLFSQTFGFVASILIIFFIGLYTAIDPGLYRKGFLSLVPIPRRARAGEILSNVEYALRWWLLGKLISMSIIGILTAVGLWLLGVPLALTLGIIAAFFTFIPNIGPILSAVPAILLALMNGLMPAVYVAMLYVGIQTVESYFITPFIQQRTVSLPPALTLSAQVLLGVLFGAIGLVLATPIMAALLVLIRCIYVEDILGDKPLAAFSGDQNHGM